MKVVQIVDVSPSQFVIEVTVDELPRGIALGCLLHQGNRAWKIAGQPGSSDPDEETGDWNIHSTRLILKSEVGTRGAPDLGEVYL